MNVLILVLGTRGDLELFLALGRALDARGHRVTIASSAFHGPSVRRAGLGWERVTGGDLAEMIGVLRSVTGDVDGRTRTLAFFDRWLRPRLAEALPKVTALAARSDYFISNLKIVLSKGGGIMPGASVTYDPPADVADLARFSSSGQGGKVLELVAMSRRLVDPDGTWGDPFRFTGFWRYRSRVVEPAIPELVGYVERGPPPVALTMGSMAIADPERLAMIASEALGRLGLRGVLASGWSGIEPGLREGGSLYVAGEVPYDWLFPKASCIIHHGGAGTVDSAIRAGKVSILTPLLLAQENFARCLIREKLATDVLDLASMTSARLASAIDRAIGDEQARSSALAWQAILDDEGGAEQAAGLIESHYQTANQPRPDREIRP